MKKLSYSWNPDRMSRNTTYSGLTLVERGVFRAILDLIWSSNHQYKIPLDYNEIADAISHCREQTTIIIDKCVNSKDPLFELELDVSEAILFVLFTDFQSEINRFINYEQNTDLKSAAPGISKIASLISNRENGISETKPALFRFEGLLPTNRYDSVGQMFKVTEHLKNKLRKIVSENEMEATLNDVFQWLKKYPEKRKSYSQMETFVISWARNNGSFTCDHADLEEELNRLIAEENARMAV